MLMWLHRRRLLLLLMLCRKSGEELRELVMLISIHAAFALSCEICTSRLGAALHML